MAAKKKSSKTAFILGLPLDMPAAEVVAKAKEAGLSFTGAYVHAIRSSKRRAEKTAGRRGGERSRNRRGLVESRRPRDDESVEARFVALALDVGLSRAEDLLMKIRAQVSTIRV